MTLAEKAAALGHKTELESMGPGAYRVHCSKCGMVAATMGSDDPELLYQRSGKSDAIYMANEHARGVIDKAGA